MSAVGAPGYLEALERELADLAPDERADLLEEVEASLAEIEDDPVARLGSPASFAAELRESAGLPPAPGAAAPEPRHPPLRERLAPHLRTARAVALELAPIWWAARAYVAVAAVVLLAWPERSLLVPTQDGNIVLGAAALLGALAVSVAVGLAGRRRLMPARGARIALDLLLAVMAIPVAMNAFDDARWGETVVVEVAGRSAPAGLANDGQPIRNIYPYDRRGRLLHDVRLYDGAGHPLDVLRGAYNPYRARVTAGGDTVFNAFPIRYVEPGTSRVTNPDAVPPELSPPPLTSRTPSSP